MKNQNLRVTSFNVSKEALEKIDQIAYLTGRSRSMVVDSVLRILSDYTLTRCVKRAVKEKENGNIS